MSDGRPQPRATVLIPTHDHGALLEFSVGSVRAQTVEDIEILVVGDGVPDVTRDLMRDLCRLDERIRFFDNEKGPRLGETHRHAALAEAAGRIVCYLSDDDLWFPNHLEVMEELLTEADFGHTLVTWFGPDGELFGAGVDLALDAVREQVLNGWGPIGLTVGGHTLEAYRKLPFGWRTTPTDTWTDLYMWQQFLSEPWCRARSSFRLTALHFPNPGRKLWTAEQRCGELEAFAKRLPDPSFQTEMEQRCLRYFAEEWGRMQLGLFDRGRVGHQKVEGAALALSRSEAELARVAAELARTRDTRTWRLRSKMLSLPGVARAVHLSRRLAESWTRSAPS